MCQTFCVKLLCFVVTIHLLVQPKVACRRAIFLAQYSNLHRINHKNACINDCNHWYMHKCQAPRANFIENSCSYFTIHTENGGAWASGLYQTVTIRCYYWWKSCRAVGFYFVTQFDSICVYKTTKLYNLFIFIFLMPPKKRKTLCNEPPAQIEEDCYNRVSILLLAQALVIHNFAFHWILPCFIISAVRISCADTRTCGALFAFTGCYRWPDTHYGQPAEHPISNSPIYRSTTSSCTW
jgi:hypothetical protein